MKTVFCSGINTASFIYLIASEGGSVMVSPPKAARQPAIKRALQETGCRAILDSGAFQGQTDCQAYADILCQTHQLFEWIPNLDVIGDQAGSNRNFATLKSVLPAEVSKKLVWVYQGGDLAQIREYSKESPLVGIGGLVPYKDDFVYLQQYLQRVGAVLNECGATAHVFGITGFYTLKWLVMQNWFSSTDSTRWLSGMRSSEIFTMHGRSFRESDGFLFTPEERARHAVRVLNAIAASTDRLQLSLLGEAV